MNVNVDSPDAGAPSGTICLIPGPGIDLSTAVVLTTVAGADNTVVGTSTPAESQADWIPQAPDCPSGELEVQTFQFTDTGGGLVATHPRRLLLRHPVATPPTLLCAREPTPGAGVRSRMRAGGARLACRRTRPPLSQAESPQRSAPGHAVTGEDVRELMGASTPHFALQLRNRIAKLIAPLAADDPARLLGEQEIRRLAELAFDGETRGGGAQDGQRPLPSLSG